MKITFIGDIACDKPLLKAAKLNEGIYDFSSVFVKTKNLFEDSDYVIANFETVCGGNKNGYQNAFMTYNAPDQLIYDVKKAGIDCLTTANNHCLDQGIAGLKRTIELMNKVGLEHTGTFVDKNDNHILYKTINNVNIAILAYTQSTNESNTGVVLNSKNDYHVNILKNQRLISTNSSFIKKVYFLIFPTKVRKLIKRFVFRRAMKKGKTVFKPFVDILQPGDDNNYYLEKLKDEISEAKAKADYVIVCPHVGGQFNELPGEYSKLITKILIDFGADVVIGNHPHTIQKIEMSNNNPIAFSLGSYNLSPSAEYIIHDCLPEYSLAFHCYFGRNCIPKYTFSILKVIEDENHMLTVWPVDDLYLTVIDTEKEKIKNDVKKLLERIYGKSVSEIKIQSEYKI